MNKDCQKALFSATYDDNVMSFAKKIIQDPVILRLKKEEQSLDNIKQFYVRCQNEEDKFKALANIYGTITVGQAMVFCHVSSKVSWISLLEFYEIFFFVLVLCSVGVQCIVHLFHECFCAGDLVIELMMCYLTAGD